MSATTGPVLAIGAITITNNTIFNNRPMDWRVPVATGLAAALFSGAERMWADGAKALAWMALVAVCLTRIDPDVPSPVESALIWWDRGSKPPARRTTSV